MGDEWLRANAAISFVLYVKLHCIVSVGLSSLSMLPCAVPYTPRPSLLTLNTGMAC